MNIPALAIAESRRGMLGQNKDSSMKASLAERDYKGLAVAATTPWLSPSTSGLGLRLYFFLGVSAPAPAPDFAISRASKDQTVLPFTTELTGSAWLVPCPAFSGRY